MFHFVSGRIGNGLMVSMAIGAGALVLMLELRQAESESIDDVIELQSHPDDYWWPDAADHLDDDGWLDRVTDEPLPGPFREVFEALQRDPSASREDAPSP